MKTRAEIFGLGCETLGLVIVLAATLWQFAFNEQWEVTAREWQNYIQEEVNLSLLYSMVDLARLASEPDANRRYIIRDKIAEASMRSVSRAIDERNKRDTEMNRGQYSKFAFVRRALLLFGAMLLVLGKFLGFAGARSSGAPQAGSPTAPT